VKKTTGSVGRKLDALAAQLRTALNTFATSARLQLKSVQATVNDMDARMELLELEFDNADERREKDTRAIIRAVYRTGAWIGFSVAVLVVVAVLAVVIFLRTSAAEKSSPAARESVANASPRSASGAAGTAASTGTTATSYPAQPSEIAEGLGETRKSIPMPHQPLLNQAHAPCRGVAREFFGSCWVKIADTTPPCPPDTYQEGDGCYMPLAANPKQPVGEPKQHQCPERPCDGLPVEQSVPEICRP